jgi:hypothetical protein
LRTPGDRNSSTDRLVGLPRGRSSGLMGWNDRTFSFRWRGS